MPIEGFNSEQFSQSLAQQAIELLPKDFSEEQKKLAVNTIYKFCVLAGNAIVEDQTINFNANQASFIVQCIGEWTYHKSVDLIRSQVPSEHWDNVLQKIAFSVFEVGKQAQLNNLPQEQAITLIENQVNKTYKEIIAEMIQAGILDETKAKEALSQSNIDQVSQELQEKQTTNIQNDTGNNNKSFKAVSLAILLKNISPKRAENILKQLDEETAKQVLSYYNVPDLEDKVDKKLVNQYLNNLHSLLPSTKAKAKKIKSLNKIADVIENFPPQQIESLVRFEREEVRKYIKACIDHKYEKIENMNITPYISEVICNYLITKLSN